MIYLICPGTISTFFSRIKVILCVSKKAKKKNVKRLVYSQNKQILEPPPLPATLPPVGGHVKQTRITSTTMSYSSGPNINNNSDGTVRSTTSWHLQSHNLGPNNNGENILSSQMLTNNNFLDNERAASAIAAG